MMQITERLGCVSDAGADPALRCRIKCVAAVLGAVVLIAVVSVGYLLHAGETGRPAAVEAEAAAHE